MLHWGVASRPPLAINFVQKDLYNPTEPLCLQENASVQGSGQTGGQDTRTPGRWIRHIQIP